MLAILRYSNFKREEDIIYCDLPITKKKLAAMCGISLRSLNGVSTKTTINDYYAPVAADVVDDVMRLTHAEQRLFVYFAASCLRFANFNRTVEQIADDTGLGITAVYAGINTLIDMNYIKRVGCFIPKRKAYSYRTNIDIYSAEVRNWPSINEHCYRISFDDDEVNKLLGIAPIREKDRVIPK